ncbi:MAG: nitrogen fixation protein NifK [Oscillospiraceae bacterium]|nr:nitrogen fixation protein NifK [Oscillospiraceae bacterium]
MSEIVQYPRGSCALGGAAAAVTHIKRAIPIYHSGPGCQMQTMAGQRGPSASNYYYIGDAPPSTNLYEREIVFGGLDRLDETIAGTLEIYDGDLFFVLSGCSADIIGDDTASVVEKYRRQGVEIVYVDTGGFKGDTFYGYQAVLDAIAEKIALPTDIREPRTVNIFGLVPTQEIFWAGNFEEITRILNKLGVKANTFFSDSGGLAELQQSSRAALNVNFSPWLCRNTEEIYKERFGIETLHFDGLPVGPTSTTAFVRKLADALQLDNDDVERVIREEEDYVWDYLEALGESRRYRLAIVGDTNTVIGLSRFFVEDYGQILLDAVIVDDIPESADRDRIREILTSFEYGKPPKVHFEADYFKIKELLKDEPVEMLLGSSFEHELSDELNTVFFNVSFPARGKRILNRGYAGYRGSLTLLEDFFYPY